MQASELKERIREVCGSPEDVAKAELDHLSQEYAEHVREANRRLSRCSQWLKLGLRTEAVHHADQAPDLLDTCAALDLGSELEPWKSLCEANDMASGPDLNWDAAAELNEAYGTERSLRRLLRQHRRAALSHAPFRERIHILRLLRKADESNPLWERNLIELERARITGINREARSALEEKNLAHLEALEEELRSPQWIERPRSTLAAAVTEARQTVVHHLAKTEYARIAKQVHEAMGAIDRKAVERLHGEWLKILESTNVRAPEDLALETQQAFDWLGELREREQQNSEYEAACRRLEAALDDRLPEQDIERLHAAVLRLERGIPQVLEQRTQSLLSEFRLDRSRRFRLIGIGLASVAIITIIVTAWAIFSRSQSQELDRWLVRITNAVEGGQLDRASELLAQIEARRPRLHTAPEIQDLQARVDDALAADAERRQAFLAAIDAAEVAGVEEPNLDALDRAASLAATDRERQRVQAHQDRVQAAMARRQRERDNAFVSSLEEYRDQFDELRKQVERADAIEEIEGLYAKAVALKQGMDALCKQDGISPNLVEGARSLQTATTAMPSSIQTMIGRRQERERLLRRIGEPPARVHMVAQALSEFLDKFPDKSPADEFSRAMRHSEAWLSVEAWYDLLDEGRESLDVNTHAVAETRRSHVEEYQANHKVSLGEQALANYLVYLDSAALALQPESAPATQLGQILNNPFVSKLSVVNTGDGQRVYTMDGELRVISGGYSLTHAVRSVEDATQGAAPTKGFLISAAETDPPLYIEWSAQRKWAHSAKAVLDNAGREQWQDIYLTLLEMLLESPNMDEIVRLLLASQLYHLHVQLPWRDDPEVRSWLANVGQVDLTVNWLEPTADPKVAAARKDSRALLAKIPAPDGVRERLRHRWNMTVAELDPRQPAGIMWHDEQGKKAVKETISATRYEVVVPANKGNYAFVEVARRMNNEVKLLPEADTVPYGTPVFASVK